MWKDKMRSVFDAVIRHSKIVFPIVIIAAVAVTVTVALRVKNAGGKGEEVQTITAQSAPSTGETQATEELTRAVPNDPLELNLDSALHSLIATYYNALAGGDIETIRSIGGAFDDMEEIRVTEMSKYIETYPVIDIYTKKGPEENSYIAYVSYKVTFTGFEDHIPGMESFYVCTNENGELYINSGEVEEDILDYIAQVSRQDDVVELRNRVTVEYNELCLSNSKLFDYVNELTLQVNKATGEALAAAQAQQEQSAQAQQEQNAQEAPSGDAGEAPSEGTEEQPPADQPSVPAGPLFATATTTVNVRSSDSENAEKLGKVAGGTKLEVSEQRANGWSRVVYEGKEGYIKSEYLQVAESAEGAETIGTIKASANLNVRASASETAEKLGIMAGGDSAELISEENGWCKIKYNGQIGYVKAEYIER